MFTPVETFRNGLSVYPVRHLIVMPYVLHRPLAPCAPRQDRSLGPWAQGGIRDRRPQGPIGWNHPCWRENAVAPAKSGGRPRASRPVALRATLCHIVMWTFLR